MNIIGKVQKLFFTEVACNKNCQGLFHLSIPHQSSHPTSPKRTFRLVAKNNKRPNFLLNCRPSGIFAAKRYSHSNADFHKHLYHILKDDNGYVPVKRILKAFQDIGLWNTDPRLVDILEEIENQVGEDSKFKRFSEEALSKEAFISVANRCPNLLKKVFAKDMIIPEFEKFTSIIKTLFESCKSIKGGKPAMYIPQLAKVCPDLWAVSICTVDGQRFSAGDFKEPFTMQSASKPLLYALAVNELGSDFVHKYVGCEPSGESFNSIKLSSDNRPHNPMINIGAMVVSSMIKPELDMGQRFEFVQRKYSQMAGGDFVSFNNSVYLSEKATANRNLALGYYLKEHECFPPKSDLEHTLDLYFMNCSVEITVNSGAVIASTLANGGYCPLTKNQILNQSAVRNTLVLMHSCGMYDYSGNFSFKVGLPAKSAVSGCIIMIVPNVMGVCLWSPLIDSIGNSCKGVHFCEELVNIFNFHHYDSLIRADQKIDPRIKKFDHTANSIGVLCSAAKTGNFMELRTLALHGAGMNSADYDNRTALHIAAAEGHLDCVKFLVERCGCEVGKKDRWNRTALDDAIFFNHSDVANYFSSLKQHQVN